MEKLEKCIPASYDPCYSVYWDRQIKKFVVFNETWSDIICEVDTYTEAQEILKKYCDEYL